MQAMMTNIAVMSAFTPLSDKQLRPPSESSSTTPAATSSNHDGASRAQPVRDNPTDKKIAFDDAGFTIVRTVDVSTGDVLAQNPTEAYLRLAHAMIGTVRGDPIDGSATDVLA